MAEPIVRSLLKRKETEDVYRWCSKYFVTPSLNELCSKVNSLRRHNILSDSNFLLFLFQEYLDCARFLAATAKIKAKLCDSPDLILNPTHEGNLH